MKRRFTLLAAVIALTPGLALAQATSPATPTPLEAPAPATATTPPSIPTTTAIPPGRARSPAARLSQLDSRISDLHTRLKITPAQEPQWTALTNVMRANATRMGEMYQSGNPQTMSAVDSLKHYARIAQAHSEEITSLVAPFQTLYEAMTPAQQKLADSAFHSAGRVQPARG